MKSIPKKWYNLYNWTLVAISGFFIILYTLTKVIHSSIAADFNLTLESSFFALLAIVMGIVGFMLLSNKLGPRPSAAITTMVFDIFIVLQLANTSHGFLFLYILIWWGLALFSGSLGLMAVFIVNLLAIITKLLATSYTIGSSSSALLVMFFGTVVISSSTYYLFWQSKLKTNEKSSNLGGFTDNPTKENATLIESIGDGVFVADRTGKINLFNPAASLMTEWEGNDALGVDVNLVLKITDENDKDILPQNNPFNSVLQTNSKLETSVMLTGRKGKKIIVSLVVSPVLIGDQPVGIVGVMRDISAQRAAERQRADFISTASHEMRTPVAAIEGYLSLAMNTQVANIDTKARDFLEKAHSSTQQLGKLFQDLLTSSRADDGRLTNHPQVIEMGEFIKHLAESFQLAAQKKHLIVDFVVINENGGGEAIGGKVINPLYYVHVDPERISEVVTNLFDNAIKYTQAGKIIVGLGGDSNHVQVFIQDTGPGISSDDVPHLFQKFYRVDNSAVRTIGGTGLGLYICKKIVELYGGQIWVESEIGKGSTFRINIPRLTSQQADSLKRTEQIQDQIAMPSSNATL